MNKKYKTFQKHYERKIK